jgi:hypothetical protein
MNFELMFWVMMLAAISAIFVSGALLGAWLAWKYVATRDAVNRKKTKSTADMEAHIEYLTNKIEELTAMSRRRNTTNQVANNVQMVYATRDGKCWHSKPDCFGLGRVQDEHISSKIACRICVKALQSQSG